MEVLTYASLWCYSLKMVDIKEDEYLSWIDSILPMAYLLNL